MRSIRLTPARVSTAVVTAALAVTLTACGGHGNDASKDTDTQSAAAPSASASTGTAGTAPTASSDGTNTDATSAGSSGTSTKAPAAGASSDKNAGGGDCTLDASSVQLKDTGGTIPLVLLTFTNTGSSTCAVYNAPIVSDPAAGDNITVDKNTAPQAVVELAHGQTAYASITLSNTPTHRAKTLNVSLASSDGAATDGHAPVASPGSGGLGLDDSSKVTYWQSTQEAAQQ